MNSSNYNDNDVTLRRVMREWTVPDSLPPRFGERVWQRIAREESAEPPRVWRPLWNWLGSLLSRPSPALSYVTVLLLAGVLAGYWHGRQENTRTLENLGTRYVQMMEPFQSAHP